MEVVLTPRKELQQILEGLDNFQAHDLARLLSGNLPALGSDYLPADYIWQCLRTDDKRREQEASLAKLCAELLDAVFSAQENEQDYLLNLFLLGQMLQDRDTLFQPALALEQRGNRGEVPLNAKLRRELRRLVIFNQADISLRDRWFSILKNPDSHVVSDLMDAFLGLMWLRAENSNGIPLDDIRKGLPFLADALSLREQGEEYLRAGLRALITAFPNDRWAEWLSEDFEKWPALLCYTASEEIPGLQAITGSDSEELTTAQTDDILKDGMLEAFGTSEAPPGLWEWLAEHGIVAALRSRILEEQFSQMEQDAISLFEALKACPLPKTMSPGVFLSNWIHAVQRACGYSHDRINLKYEDDEVEEKKNAPYLTSIKRSPFEMYKSVSKQIENIVGKLQANDLFTARQWEQDLVNSQLRDGTAPALIAKSLSNLAANALRLGHFQLAEEWAENANEVAPDDVVARNGLADTIKTRGRLEEAENLYRETTQRFRDDVVAHNGLADTIKTRGRLEEAENLYRETTQRFHDDVVAHNGLADTIKTRGRLEEAEKLYKQTTDRFPDDVVAHCGLADTVKTLGRLEEAEQLYKQTTERFPDAVVARNGLAETLKTRGRLEEAEQLYKETTERFPDDVVARCGLADTVKTRGRLEEAEQLYKETTERFPDDVVAHCGLADTVKTRGRLEEAEQLYKQTTERFPDAVVARNGLAETLKTRGRLEEAEQLYRETIQMFPNNKFAPSGLASVLAKMGKNSLALALLPFIDNPQSKDDWVIHHQKATILLRTDNREEALPLLTHGHQSCPFPEDREYYRFVLAFYAIKQGNLDNAEELLKEQSAFAALEAIRQIALLHLTAAREQVEAARQLLTEIRQAKPTLRLLDLLDQRYGLETSIVEESEKATYDLRIFREELELPLAA